MYPKSILHYISAVLIASLFTVSTAWGQTCDAPGAPSKVANSETATSTSFTWAASIDDPMIDNPVQGYRWQVRTSGLPTDGLGAGYVSSGSTPNGVTSTTVNDLETLTEYQFYVRYQCAASDPDDGNNYSAWSIAAEFETGPVAPPVITSENNIMHNSFRARWQHSAGATHYLLSVYTEDPTEFSTPLAGYNDLYVGYNNSHIVTGLTSNTNYWYRVKAVGGEGDTLNTSEFSASEQVLTASAPPLLTTWEGPVTGWTPIDPNYDVDVIINADYNTATYGYFEAKNLIVNPGVILTIAPGYDEENEAIVNNYVRVQNAITNDSGTAAGITVETNGNLGQDNDDSINTGDITVRRESSAIFRLDYTMWSSPVDGPQTLHQFSPLTDLNRFYEYDTSDNDFQAVDPDITFEAAKGYLIRVRNTHVPYVDGTSVPQKWTGEFVGVPRNNYPSIPLEYNGLTWVDMDEGPGEDLQEVSVNYNMVGNPYPSAISAEEFLADNAGVIEGKLHFWRRKNNSDGTGAYNTFYASYTTLGGAGTDPVVGGQTPTGEISTGQGFLVNAIATGDLQFFNTHRLPNASLNVFFRSQTIVEKNRIWLNLTDGTGGFSQALVGYMTGASNGVDSADGTSLNDGQIALTSELNNRSYVIQARALPFSDTDVVPMKVVIPAAGDYTIAIDHVDGLFEADQDIYLRDNLLNIIHDLKAGPYTFVSEVGSFNNRFDVIYQSELNTNNPVLDANNVVVFKRNADIVINSGALTMASVKVFDIRGRLLAEQSNVNASETSINAGSDKQVLIVQITTNDNRVVSKKIVN